MITEEIARKVTLLGVGYRCAERDDGAVVLVTPSSKLAFDNYKALAVYLGLEAADRYNAYRAYQGGAGSAFPDWARRAARVWRRAGYTRLGVAARGFDGLLEYMVASGVRDGRVWHAVYYAGDKAAAVVWSVPGQEWECYTPVTLAGGSVIYERRG